MNYSEKKNNITIKVGTNVLTTSNGSLDLNSMRNIAYQISELQKKNNINITLVSSGAITCGSEQLRVKPKTIPDKQAAAAIGQILLLKEYQEFFSHKSQSIAQILLTKDGIADPIRKTNILNTIKNLHNRNILPIINENDSVCTDEIEENFGDNDILSSELAHLCKSEMLIILTDIDGLYSKAPSDTESATLIPYLNEVSDNYLTIAKGPASSNSKGGMQTKLLAAKYLLKQNIKTVIANGKKNNILNDILNNNFIGTLIEPKK